MEECQGSLDSCRMVSRETPTRQAPASGGLAAAWLHEYK